MADLLANTAMNSKSAKILTDESRGNDQILMSQVAALLDNDTGATPSKLRNTSPITFSLYPMKGRFAREDVQFYWRWIRRGGVAETIEDGGDERVRFTEKLLFQEHADHDNATSGMLVHKVQFTSARLAVDAQVAVAST
ncbi:hypothetical protein FI667_g17062, partial [Globisporangium splendens]